MTADIKNNAQIPRPRIFLLNGFFSVPRAGDVKTEIWKQNAHKNREVYLSRQKWNKNMLSASTQEEASCFICRSYIFMGNILKRYQKTVKHSIRKKQTRKGQFCTKKQFDSNFVYNSNRNCIQNLNEKISMNSKIWKLESFNEFELKKVLHFNWVDLDHLKRVTSLNGNWNGMKQMWQRWWNSPIQNCSSLTPCHHLYNSTMTACWFLTDKDLNPRCPAENPATFGWRAVPKALLAGRDPISSECRLLWRFLISIYGLKGWWGSSTPSLYDMSSGGRNILRTVGVKFSPQREY